jgi:hypothetical protein
MAPPNFDSRIKLLQFIHRLYTDSTFQTQFAADPEGCMSEYELTSDQKTAVYHAGVDPLYLDPEGRALVADWWKEYALWRKDPKNPYPDRSKYKGLDRGEGEVGSMSGVVALMIEELCGKDQYQKAW